jgi:ribonuclease P protein component
MARFSRSERIRRRADFQQVYEHGTRVHGPFFTLFLLAGQPQDSPGRLGIAATKKLGGAVVRNRAKRLIREVFRKVKIARGYDVVLVPKRELLSASLTALEAEYRAIVDRSMRRAAAQQGGRGGVRRDARARPSQGV